MSKTRQLERVSLGSIAGLIGFLLIATPAVALDKITGPWLWVIAPTVTGGGGAASIDIDQLSLASSGAVTEEMVANNGVLPGDVVGGKRWTLGAISPTGDDNVNDVVKAIGLGTGDVDDHSAYALISLDSPTNQPNVTMRVGSDDSIKVWLNGAVVYTNAINRGAMDFLDTFQVNLRGGENLLLVKVSERNGQWAMFVGIDAKFTAFPPGRGSGEFPVDHFLGYRAETPVGQARSPERRTVQSGSTAPVVILKDEFGSGRYRISKIGGHYNPAMKTTSQETTVVMNPGVHLEAYRLLRVDGTHAPQTREVTNQFGAITVTTKTPSHLLVPSTSRIGLKGDPPAREVPETNPALRPEQVVDPFLCYSLDSFEGFTRREVGVNDRFDPLRGEVDNAFIVSEPTALCNPVGLQPEGNDAQPIKDNVTHLVCFGGGFRELRRLEVDLQVTDRFGSKKLKVDRDAGTLCVPSTVREKKSPPIETKGTKK